jgi:hypothetical protein
MDRIMPTGDWRRAMRLQSHTDAACTFPASSLLTLALFLTLFLSPLAQAAAVPQPDFENTKNLDFRWLPWIGSWRLISNTVNQSDSGMKGSFLLTIGPGPNLDSVVMTGSRDGVVLFDGKVVAAGSRQPIQEENCKGWYEYSWSDTGKRLLFSSESTCADGVPRKISGLSIFTGRSEWADIQLMQSGEEKVITIRRYLASDTDMSLADIKRTTALNADRIEASTNFSINEIIEMTPKTASEVLEAALMEMRKPFPLDAKSLERLADAGVPPKIVDLMVAITYPDRFTVQRNTVAPREEPKPVYSSSGTFIGYPYPWSSLGYWYPYDPFFPFYNAYSPFWWYGYWWWDYPYYWGPPYYPGGGYGIDRGRLVAGDGYSRVSPANSSSGRRFAVPRNGYVRSTAGGGRGANQGGGRSSGSAQPSGGGGYSTTAGSSAGSAGAGAASGSSSPSASPGGYSGGGGGQAKPR